MEPHSEPTDVTGQDADEQPYRFETPFGVFQIPRQVGIACGTVCICAFCFFVLLAYSTLGRPYRFTDTERLMMLRFDLQMQLIRQRFNPFDMSFTEALDMQREIQTMEKELRRRGLDKYVDDTSDKKPKKLTPPRGE